MQFTQYTFTYQYKFYAYDTLADGVEKATHPSRNYNHNYTDYMNVFKSTGRKAPELIETCSISESPFKDYNSVVIVINGFIHEGHLIVIPTKIPDKSIVKVLFNCNIEDEPLMFDGETCDDEDFHCGDLQSGRFARLSIPEILKADVVCGNCLLPVELHTDKFKMIEEDESIDESDDTNTPFIPYRNEDGEVLVLYKPEVPKSVAEYIVENDSDVECMQYACQMH